MQTQRQLQGQSMAPAIEYQVQRIWFDTWRRCGDAGVRWTQNALEECNRIGQDMLNAPLNHCRALGDRLSDYQEDMLQVVSDAQLGLARTLGDSTRATADTARQMAEQQAGQFERAGQQQAGALREQAGELREQGSALAEQAAQGMQHGAQAHPGEHAPQGTPPHGAEKRDAGGGGRDGQPRGKGGQDSASTVHQRAAS